jgi:hypothetical protein
MSTSTTTLSFRQAVSVTLCLCLTTSSVLAQKASTAGAAKPTASAQKSGTKGTAPASTTPPPPAPPPTPATPPLSEALTGQAQADYQAARLLYGDGDFAGASLKFKQAFETSKDVRLLWNMAACEKNLRHYSKVYKLVERYVDLGGSTLPDSDKKDAAELLDAMKSYISRVKISVNEVDATVTIDDEVIGMSPLMETVLLDMGSRRIRVTKPGFGEYSETVQVQGASELPLTIKLVKESHEGRIAISAGASDMLYLDGKMVGTGRWEGVVPSGTHTLRVTAQGMKAYQTDVFLNDKETRTVGVTLEPEAKKEGGNALWWVIGGVLVAGAATSTVYLVTRNNDPGGGTTQPVLGTIQPGSVQLMFPMMRAH